MAYAVPELMQQLEAAKWICLPRTFLDNRLRNGSAYEQLIALIQIHSLGHEYQTPFAARFTKSEWSKIVTAKQLQGFPTPSDRENILRPCHISQILGKDPAQVSRLMKRALAKKDISIDEEGRIFPTDRVPGCRVAAEQQLTNSSHPAEAETVTPIALAAAAQSTTNAHDIFAHQNPIPVDETVKAAGAVINKEEETSRNITVSECVSTKYRSVTHGREQDAPTLTVPTHPPTHSESDEIHSLKDELNEIWQLLNRLCTPRLGKAPDMDLCRIVWTALQPASIRQLEVRLLARLNSVTSYGLIPALAGDCARSAPAWQQATQSPQNSQTFNPEAEAYAQRCAEEAGLS